MKRKILLLVFVCCTLFLASCGAVSEVEKSIEQIGLVTMESREMIENAEKLYEALPAEKKEKVENYYTLIYARNEYDRLVSSVQAVENAIIAIGEVTKDSGSAIELAQDAYFELSIDGNAAYLTNYHILRNAEEQYSQILLQQAENLLSKRKYQEAYNAFEAIMTDFSHCSVLSAALEGEAAAMLGLTEKLFNAGKLEETMYTLQDLIMRYGDSEGTNALWEKLENRLMQQRPQNGRTFKNTVNWGQGEFTVAAGSSDACIKLEDITDPSKYILFYVRAGEKATVKVKDGQYTAKYVTGQYWFNQESMFGRDSSFTKAENTLDFTTTHEGSYTYYSVIEITLYEVAGGNMETSAISADAF